VASGKHDRTHATRPTAENGATPQRSRHSAAGAARHVALTDATTVVLVTAVLLIVTTLASNVPARRAVTVNPTVVLRAD
jgi:hypothetical protein